VWVTLMDGIEKAGGVGHDGGLQGWRESGANFDGGRRGGEVKSRLRPGSLAYSRPAGARVALLRSPILPTAQRRINQNDRGIQPRITRGANRRFSANGNFRPADIPNAVKQRTFLLRCDKGLTVADICRKLGIGQNAYYRWR
jgi:hypothetical protein